MFLSFIAFELLAFTSQTSVLMFVSFILGLTNAGTRILRITYLFEHIPNNIMGRTGSVFNTINIFLRFVFIALFTLPFFNQSNNVIWAYCIGGLFIFISIIPLIIYYKRLIFYKNIDE